MKKILVTSVFFIQLLVSSAALAIPIQFLSLTGNTPFCFDDIHSFELSLGDMSRLPIVSGVVPMNDGVKIDITDEYTIRTLTWFFTRTFPNPVLTSDEGYMYLYETLHAYICFWDSEGNCKQGSRKQEPMLDLSSCQIEGYYLTQAYFDTDQGVDYQISLYANTTTVPEPTGMLLLGTGMVILAASRRRRA